MASTKKKKHKAPLLIGISIIALLAGTLFVAFYFLFIGSGPRTQYTRHGADLKTSKERPKRATPVISPSRRKIRAATQSKAKLAIIIDDIGHQKRLAEKIIALDLQLTFSILPGAPFTSYLAQKAKERGRDILLHLPMEPADSKWDPGPGALMLNMPYSEIAATLESDLKAVPAAIGINNHMGSKFSKNRRAVQFVLRAVKEKDLFFIDSLTSAQSVIYPVARENGIKTARRDVFIDNEKDSAKIQRQLAALIKLAKKHGQAIGIGHPYKATLTALATYQQTLQQEVELVGIHQLVQ